MNTEAYNPKFGTNWNLQLEVWTSWDGIGTESRWVEVTPQNHQRRERERENYQNKINITQWI